MVSVFIENSYLSELFSRATAFPNSVHTHAKCSLLLPFYQIVGKNCLWGRLLFLLYASAPNEVDQS